MTARRLAGVSDDALLAALHAGLAEAPETELLAAADTLAAIHGPTPADLAAALAQPIACVTTRYRCPWCRRFSRSRKAAVADHMTRCWRNPAVRACVTCAHFSRTEPEPEVGLSGYEYCEAQHFELAAVQDGCPLWALRSVTP